MINKSSLKEFTHFIERGPKNIFLERWLDRTRELEKNMSEKVLNLSYYLSELPKTSYPSYADMLISVLEESELELIQDSDDFYGRLEQFTALLVDSGHQDKAIKLKKMTSKSSNKETENYSVA